MRHYLQGDVLFYASCAKLIDAFFKADGFISLREINLFENRFRMTYHLDDEEVARLSKTLSFSTALSCVAASDKKLNVLDDLIRITGTYDSADGLHVRCSSQEARMLLAAKYVIEEDCHVFSAAMKFRISRKEVLYVENLTSSWHKSYDQEICDNFAYYHNKFGTYGLDFESVRHTAEQYELQTRIQKGKESLVALLDYLYASDTDLVQRTSVLNNLPRATTRDFTDYLLSAKPDMLRNLKPSLLLKITDSMIEDKHERVTDFLLIPIRIEGSSRVLDDTINKICKDFQELSNEQFSEFKPNVKGHFNVKGWDKTFLDWLISKESCPTTVTKVDVVCEGSHWFVKFIGGNNVVICRWRIAPQSLAFYILVVYMSSIGRFVVSNDDPDTCICGEHKEALHLAKSLFPKIYDKVRTREKDTTDSTFTQMFQKLKYDKGSIDLPETLKIKETRVSESKTKYVLWTVGNDNLPMFTINGNGLKAQTLAQFLASLQ